MERALEACSHCSTESQIRELLNTLTERGRARLVSHGHIALQRAIASKNAGVARALLEQPEIQVNLPLASTTQDGSTVLHTAVLMQDKHVARLILDRVDLDPGVGNLRGETPLHLAAASSCPDVLDLLISDSRVDIAALTYQIETALHVACKVASHANVLEIVRKLLESVETNPRIRLAELIEKRDVLGRTALHYAAENGLDETISELLNRLEPEGREHFALVLDDRGHIALHLAAEKGNLSVVQCLLAYGDHIIPSPAIHRACRSGHRDIVRACLTSACCRLPEKTDLEEMIRFFLELFTITTHHGVAMCLQESLCEFLTLNPVAHKTECASDLLHWAIKVDDAHGLIGHILKWQPEMANSPLDANMQQSPLHVATLLGKERAVQALCREGAPWWLNGNALDVHNNTALDLAFESLNQPIQRILMETKDVKQQLSQLHKTREVYTSAANAILVVSTLIVSQTLVKCLTPQQATDERNAEAGESLELKIVYTVVSTRMAFLLALMATILAASAALPFSFGFFFQQTVGDNLVRRSMFRTRLLVVLSSYCLAWSLFSVFFMFICSVYIAPWIDWKCQIICEVVVGLFIVLTIVFVAVNLVRFCSKSRKRAEPDRRKSWSRARITPLDAV